MEPATFDHEYLRRLTEGDPDTERHFCDYFGDLLWAMLRPRVRCHELMEDIRQETFARVFRGLRTRGIEHPERLGAFVVAVCRNVQYEAFRRESRFREIGEESQTMIDPASGADRDYLTRERREQVAKVMSEMPEKERALLTAVFLQERDKDEICAQFGVDRDYLRVLLHRARARFKSGFVKAFSAKQ